MYRDVSLNLGTITTLVLVLFITRIPTLEFNFYTCLCPFYTNLLTFYLSVGNTILHWVCTIKNSVVWVCAINTVATFTHLKIIRLLRSLSIFPVPGGMSSLSTLSGLWLIHGCSRRPIDLNWAQAGKRRSTEYQRQVTRQVPSLWPSVQSRYMAIPHWISACS